jgi:hypothetical protein
MGIWGNSNPSFRRLEYFVGCSVSQAEEVYPGGLDLKEGKGNNPRAYPTTFDVELE